MSDDIEGCFYGAEITSRNRKVLVERLKRIPSHANFPFSSQFCIERDTCLCDMGSYYPTNQVHSLLKLLSSNVRTSSDLQGCSIRRVALSGPSWRVSVSIQHKRRRPSMSKAHKCTSNYLGITWFSRKTHHHVE